MGKEITTDDRKWIWKFAIIVMVITTLPYIYAYVNAGPDLEFSGFFVGAEDGNSYVAKMIRGWGGDWLFRSPYTTMLQNGMIAFVPYYLLGKLLSHPDIHTQAVVLIQLMRIAIIYPFCLLIYTLSKMIIKTEQSRRVVTVLGILGGGAGWLYPLGLSNLWGSELPLEFYSPESFGFLAIFSFPHLVFAKTLLLVGFLWLLTSGNISSQIRTWFPGLSWFLLGFFQPLTIVTGWMVACSYLLVEVVRNKAYIFKNILIVRELILKASVLLITSSPWVIYNFIAFRNDAYLKIWQQQNIILSPPIFHYLLAYIFILPLVLLGIKNIVYTRNRYGWFFITWLFIFPLLAYFPNNLQRRLPEDFWVCLCIVAGVALDSLKTRRRLVIPLLLACLLSTLIILAGSVLSITKKTLPIYHDKEFIELVKSLYKVEGYNQKVIASYNTSNILPAYIPVFVYIGHGPESANLAHIQPAIETLYQTNQSELEKCQYLMQVSADYLIWGVEEKKLGSWRPINSPCLYETYQSSHYSLFSVIRDSQ
ncbi:MAG TPA: hypothetical protein VIO61_11335 [Anaerolineaceae bacterium]